MKSWPRQSLAGMQKTIIHLSASVQKKNSNSIYFDRMGLKVRAEDGTAWLVKPWHAFTWFPASLIPSTSTPAYTQDKPHIVPIPQPFSPPSLDVSHSTFILLCSNSSSSLVPLFFLQFTPIFFFIRPKMTLSLWLKVTLSARASGSDTHGIRAISRKGEGGEG